MPGINGYETLRRIRNLPDEVKVVSQSTFSFPEDRMRIESSGFDEHLWKPIAREELERVVSALMV